MILVKNHVFSGMPLASKIQRWLIAIQGHSGNVNPILVRNHVFSGMPSAPEIQRWFVAI